MFQITVDVINWILKAGILAMFIIGMGILILMMVAEFKDHQ